jgi:hypothetical protein
VRHTERFDITVLSAAIGAIGSQAVIARLSAGSREWIGPYGIGLFLGFICYLVLALVLISEKRFDAVSRGKLLVVSLLGVQPESSPKLP